MITISKARKILNKEAEAMTDEEIEKELEVYTFLSELVIERFRKEGDDINNHYEKSVQ
jgi:hypothetical protein